MKRICMNLDGMEICRIDYPKEKISMFDIKIDHINYEIIRGVARWVFNAPYIAYIWVSLNNCKAHKWYESSGFKFTGQTKEKDGEVLLGMKLIDKDKLKRWIR